VPVFGFDGNDLREIAVANVAAVTAAMSKITQRIFQIGTADFKSASSEWLLKCACADDIPARSLRSLVSS
jgi:hypothetical protein